MENIIITGDSTCDLSQELKERYRIETVPLYVNFGEESRRDGVDVQPDDIYAYYNQNGKLPTTSATTPADYMEFFSRKAREGDAVIHFNISSGFSAAHNNACLAAKEFSNVYGQGRGPGGENRRRNETAAGQGTCQLYYRQA